MLSTMPTWERYRMMMAAGQERKARQLFGQAVYDKAASSAEQTAFSHDAYRTLCYPGLDDEFDIAVYVVTLRILRTKEQYTLEGVKNPLDNR